MPSIKASEAWGSIARMDYGSGDSNALKSAASVAIERGAGIDATECPALELALGSGRECNYCYYSMPAATLVKR